MRKEDSRSRQPNHRIEQPAKQISQALRNRDVSERGKNVSKTEALEMLAQFLPDRETREYASQQICLKIIDSLSDLARGNSIGDDIQVLERGYTHLPKRWDAIQKHIHSGHSYSEKIIDEIIYFRHCYTALGTGRR